MCLKEEELEMFPQKLFMWRNMNISASYYSFLLLGIKTLLELLRQFVSWSELVNSLSFREAKAVMISWGFLILKKLPFYTCRQSFRGSKLVQCAVCLLRCLAAAALPSPLQASIFWSILTNFDGDIKIFRKGSSDILFKLVTEGRWASAFVSHRRKGRKKALLLLC